MDEVEEFVARWGLDASSSQLLVGLTPEARARVLKDFRPTEDTQNVNGRLRGFVKSVTSTDDAARQMGFTTDGIMEFALKWGLQEDSIALLLGLTPDILSRVMHEFRPNGETMNMDGRLRAFVRSVSATIVQADGVLQFAQKWGLDEDTHRFLRTLPADVLQRVLVGFTPKADTTNVSGRLRAFVKSVMTAARSTPSHVLGPALNTEMPDMSGMEAPGGLHQTLLSFAAATGLNGDSLLLLQQLPEAVAQQVMAEFASSGDVEAANQHFQAFAMSMLAAPSPSMGAILPPSQPTTGPPEDVQEFLQRWGLGVEAAVFLESLPAETLQIVLKDFRPAGDTKNMLGRLMGFARNIGRTMILPANTAPMVAPAMVAPAMAAPAMAAPAAPQVPGELETFVAAWGLDEETVRFLQGLPAEALPRVIREFTPNQDTRNVGGRLRAFARSIVQAAAPAPQDPVQQFVEQWGLDAGSAAFLQALPEEVRLKVMLGFHPHGDTVNLQGRLQAFARGVLARATVGGPGGGQHSGPVAAFAAHWGLGGSSVALLETLPVETLQRVLSEFKPPDGTFNIDGRLQGFVKSVVGAAAGKRAVEPAPLGLQAKRQRC
mmetsp:Transcript_9689/g.27312  ORF Transcript_9689/g.27312 Transcript_9689/m.27312 type:complete len:603 (-) Transcript_9689:92-1900(-)